MLVERIRETKITSLQVEQKTENRENHSSIDSSGKLWFGYVRLKNYMIEKNWQTLIHISTVSHMASKVSREWKRWSSTCVVLVISRWEKEQQPMQEDWEKLWNWAPCEHLRLHQQLAVECEPNCIGLPRSSKRCQLHLRWASAEQWP